MALAQANAEQVAARRAALAASSSHLAAAGAQTEKAGVVLGYTEIRAPIDGIVDVRAALQGEVVTPGQAIVTLIDPDDLWVRADVEESYIDRIHLGDKMTVRLPSGADTRRERFSFAAWMPTTPPSATSAAPSATSRPSKSACAATTATAASRWG